MEFMEGVKGMRNLDKKLLILLILVNIFSIAVDFLRVLGIIQFTDHDARISNIVMSLGLVIVLGFLIKHRYWILASIYWGLHTLTRISSAFLFINYGTIYNAPILILIAVGIICSGISSFYFYKLIDIEGFNFEKEIRLNDLDDYLKKKFR